MTIVYCSEQVDIKNSINKNNCIVFDVHTTAVQTITTAVLFTIKYQYQISDLFMKHIQDYTYMYSIDIYKLG